MEGEYCCDGGATSSPTMSADDLGSLVLSPSPPRKAGRRRSARKRVVTVPLADVSGPRPNGVGEGNTPTDSWTWRKYGQKLIKGSPYPRAYYRCSSSKGCPAKKQMERSRADLAMVVVSYSSEHNHSAKVPRASQSRQVQKPKPQPVTPEPAEPEGVYGKDAAVDVHDEFRWFYNGVSTSPSEEEGTDEMLYGPMFLDAGAVGTAPVLLPDECAGDEGGFGGEGGEEDGLFAGLGELPECAIVFRHRGCLAGGVKVEQPPERTATS